MLLSGAFQVGGQLFGFSQPPPAHYRMTGGPMIATALAYVGCIGSLGVGMALNNVRRKSPRRIEAEQRGEIIDRAPTGGGDGVYDDYFASSTTATVAATTGGAGAFGPRALISGWRRTDAYARYFIRSVCCVKRRRPRGAALLAES